MDKKICTLIASAAFIIGCFIIYSGMGNIVPAERSVSVRGLAEKEVDADMAVWKLTFSVGGNDLQYLQKEVVRQTAVVE